MGRMRYMSRIFKNGAVLEKSSATRNKMVVGGRCLIWGHSHVPRGQTTE